MKFLKPYVGEFQFLFVYRYRGKLGKTGYSGDKGNRLIREIAVMERIFASNYPGGTY